MNRLFCLIASIAFAGTIAGASHAQTAARSGEFVPQVGQAGKDVIWVPTPQALVERMLDMAKVTARDHVIDLGSGDGRTVITAAKKYGATALGIEYNPEMVALSERNAAQAGVSDRARFAKADIFESDFSKATVITMYLLPDLNLRLRPKLLDMKPGTRLVSHAFTMGDWEPDERAEVENRGAMLWIVPAKVNGEWTLRGSGDPIELSIDQKYQRFTGTVRRGATSEKVLDGRLSADSISFSFAEGGATRRFSGHVMGDEIHGSFDGGAAVTGMRRH